MHVHGYSKGGRRRIKRYKFEISGMLRLVPDQIRSNRVAST